MEVEAGFCWVVVGLSVEERDELPLVLVFLVVVPFGVEDLLRATFDFSGTSG